MSPKTLTDYPLHALETIRRSDVGGDYHVDNVAFAAYLDTGRSGIAFNPDFRALIPGHRLFIARVTIDYRGELHWPGTVEIGTAISAIGRTSFTLRQALFQHETCAAEAESIYVQVDADSRRPAPLSEAARAWLARYSR